MTRAQKHRLRLQMLIYSFERAIHIRSAREWLDRQIDLYLEGK